MNLSAEAKAKGLKDESVLHVINQYITLKDDDMKRNNEILNSVIQDIINVLKNKNAFFREFYSRIEFVGSHYKGTKVGQPEEFDLNLIIRLPIDYRTIEFERGLPGFVKLKLNRMGYRFKTEEQGKLLAKWIQNDYLNQDKFRQWVESLFADMPQQTRDGKYQLSLVKSGPAFTLNVRGPGLFATKMSVDLVPVLEFKKILTPLQVQYGQGDVSWFAVPKPFKSEEESPTPLNWRPSFYIYEKNMLRRDGKFKPIIRQVKKLRDNHNWKLIASYHIETLFMHEIIAIKGNPALQKLSGIELFIHMLECLKRACEKVEIWNFWDSNHNLIGHYHPHQLESIVGRLKRIIEDIKADPVKMAKYLLTDLELREVQKELDDIRNGRYTDSPSTSWTDVTSFSDVEKNENLGQILRMLKLIQNDIADTKEAINKLTSRVNQEFIRIRGNTTDTQETLDMFTTGVDKQFKLIHKEIADTKYQLGLHVIHVGNNIESLQECVGAPSVCYTDSKPEYTEWD